MNILSRSKTEARKDAERIVEQLPPSFRKTNTQKPLVPSEISYTQTEAEERIFRLEKSLVKAISERTELVKALKECIGVLKSLPEANDWDNGWKYQHAITSGVDALAAVGEEP